MGNAEDRRFDVLRAIVADFVATKEPIGSKGARKGSLPVAERPPQPAPW